MAKKYFLYTRVSNDDYDGSLENQLHILLKIAQERGIDQEDIIQYEEHKSWSKSADREKFNAMIAELANDAKLSPDKRQYGGILFFKIDRLARNDKDFNSLLQLLDAGYSFISATETIENTPTGRLLFRMLASFAVFETEKLGSRQIMAKIHNTIQRKFASLWWNAAIVGYKKLSKTDTSFVIDEDAAPIIAMIYHVYCSCDGNISYKNLYTKTNDLCKGALQELYEKVWEASQDKFIRRIIQNDNMMRYDGHVQVEVSVSDESLQQYIQSIISKDTDDDLFIYWDNKIWSKIQFSLFDSSLTIVDHILYRKKEEILARKKRQKYQKSSEKGHTLFDRLLHVTYGSEIYPITSYYKAKWEYIRYRRKVGDNTFECSESDIDKKIMQEWSVDAMIKSIQKHRQTIVKKMVAIISNNKVFKKRRAVLKASLNLYESKSEDLLYGFLQDISNPDILHLRNKYSERIAKVHQELGEIEIAETEYYDKVLILLQPFPLSDRSYDNKAVLYTFIFKEIIIHAGHESKDYRIELRPFTFLVELWLIPEKILI